MAPISTILYCQILSGTDRERRSLLGDPVGTYSIASLLHRGSRNAVRYAAFEEQRKFAP